jgi:hypothetical protein
MSSFDIEEHTLGDDAQAVDAEDVLPEVEGRRQVRVLYLVLGLPNQPIWAISRGMFFPSTKKTFISLLQAHGDGSGAAAGAGPGICIQASPELKILGVLAHVHVQDILHSNIRLFQ